MSIPFFFILGRPRSGTTLLKTLFDAHPNVKIPPELPVFLPLYQKFKNVKTWDRSQILSFIEHVFQPNVFNHRKIENMRIDKEKFTADLLKLENNCSIQDLLVEFNKQAFSPFHKEETLIVGDKNPVYSVYTKRLLKIFPDARFICIVRDYRDNFVSLRNLKDAKLEAPLLSLQVARWRIITKTFMACREKFPSRFLIVRYEDLVTEPEKTFRILCSFLEIPYNDDVFRFYEKKDEVLEMFANPAIEKIHKSLLQPVNKGRMDLWKSCMSDREVRMADLIAGKTADLMGYTRIHTKFSLTLRFRSIPMELYGRLLFVLMIAGSKLPYNASRRIALSLPMLVKFYSLIAKSRPGRSQ